MTEINQRILLRSKPTGIPQPDNFIADSVPLRTPAADEVLLETILLSIDAQRYRFARPRPHCRICHARRRHRARAAIPVFFVSRRSSSSRSSGPTPH